MLLVCNLHRVLRGSVTYSTVKDCCQPGYARHAGAGYPSGAVIYASLKAWPGQTVSGGWPDPWWPR
jgi:hypothetical protein